MGCGEVGVGVQQKKRTGTGIYWISPQSSWPYSQTVCFSLLRSQSGVGISQSKPSPRAPAPTSSRPARSERKWRRALGLFTVAPFGQHEISIFEDRNFPLAVQLQELLAHVLPWDGRSQKMSSRTQAVPLYFPSLYATRQG